MSLLFDTLFIPLPVKYLPQSTPHQENAKTNTKTPPFSVSTLLALLLDIHIFRRTISRGKYHQMGAGAPAGARSGRGSHAPTPKLAPFYSDDEGRIVDVEERRRGGSDAEDDGDDVRHAAQHHVGGQKRGDGSGYEVPEEQFEYDTEYRGGGGDLGATGGRRP